MRAAAAIAMVAALSIGGAAVAAEDVPEFGRYFAKYPDTYYSVAYSHDARDRSFDQSGEEQDSAAPTVPGHSALPQTLYTARFAWYFPLFEDAGLPFISSRVHTARMTLRYGKSEAEGALADFVATNPDFAPRSQPGDTGVGDIGFEFGSFLIGGSDWRTRKENPFALVLLLGMDMPVGSYEQTAPVTQGSNRHAFGATLGAHWRPWAGGFLEGGAGVRQYAKNENPHFGHLSPQKQGDDTLLNLSLTQRLFHGAYVGAFLTDRRGDANRYENPRYAPNAPEPDAAPPGGTTESFPVAGSYRDGGTALRTAGLSLHYFMTQRLMATVDYSTPLAGKSGQFLLPFEQRQCPAGSVPGSASCTESGNGTVLVDGQGSVRSFASSSLRFALSYNFGHSDLFSCTGCD